MYSRTNVLCASPDVEGLRYRVATAMYVVVLADVRTSTFRSVE